ncbi:urea amidolyase, partial [Nostoc sp. 3335mG]
DVPAVLGSKATSMRARLGGIEGRALRAGDRFSVFAPKANPGVRGAAGGDGGHRAETASHRDDDPVRFVWGIHADLFALALREKFVTSRFRITSMMDRMGVRLRDDSGVFSGAKILSLVSDSVTVGDIQILGDGVPIVLGRDHQPTGGYPRIGTVISADLDRFFQKRPNAEVAFSPVGVEHAQALLRSGTP